MTDKSNILRDLPDATDAEVFQTLQESGQVLIERIVSHGQASQPGFWYEQERAEWVLLMQGAARLQWGDGSITALQAGDHLLIPANTRHRVDWTDQMLPTVWVAVHFPEIAT